VRRRKRGAFTLIELLVVVAILFVLVSMLMPSIGSVREQARRAACASNLHQWGSALSAYMGDNRSLPCTVSLFTGYYPSFVQRVDYPPGQAPVTSGTEPNYGFGGVFSLTLLQAYAQGTDINIPQIRGMWMCPDADESYEDAGNQGFGSSIFGCLHCDYSYFARVDLWINDLAAGKSHASNPTEIVRRIPKSRQILMADAVYRTWEGNWTFNHGLKGRAGTLEQAPGVPVGLGGANELYGDMHVEWKDSTMFNETAMNNLQTTAVGAVPASRIVVGGPGNPPLVDTGVVIGVSPTPTTGGPFDATFYVP
jgi:type II secretory pathway pseudopilin PulG